MAGTIIRFYRPDRIVAIALVAAIHVLIAYALLTGMRVAIRSAPPDRPTLITFEPLPPPPRQPPERRVQPKQSGGNAPAGKRVPIPEIAPAPAPVLPAPPPLIVVPPSRPAPDRSAEGTGNDGGGGGMGGSGSGAGSGSGVGDGDDFTGARQIRGRFRNSDFPSSARSAGRLKIGVRFAVGPTGNVDECEIIESSGYAEVDAMTCRVIVERYRFRPARDGAGEPVTEVMEETYTWTLD